MGELPDSFNPLNLLADPDLVVAWEAIHSVGKLRKHGWCPISWTD
jgi:hypothetical protein